MCQFSFEISTKSAGDRQSIRLHSSGSQWRVAPTSRQVIYKLFTWIGELHYGGKMGKKVKYHLFFPKKVFPSSNDTFDYV